jgi:hypothetical protein
LAFGFAMGQAALKSDSVDYRPGSNAKFNGTGFQPGEVVKMQVLHSTDLADSSANEHTTVEMGASYIQGMYFVELVQGNQQKIVKLIKQ